MKKRIISMVLVLALAVGCVLGLASCGRDVEEFVGDYTYKDAVVQMSANWNPHTYQTSDESYPISFITSGLYNFVFNDNDVYELEGKDAYEGFVIVPEMAAADPIDVTEKIKDKYPQYNIPESATSGYAYRIKLNKDACWENGEKINADTYVYSMKALLDPIMQNYRATDYFDGSFSIANAKNYYYQGQTIYNDNGITNMYNLKDLTKGADGQYVTKDGNKMYVAVSMPIDWCSGYSLADYVGAYGTVYFSTTYWADLLALTDTETGLAPLTDETYKYIKDITTGNPAWGETEDDVFNYLAEEVAYEKDYSFDNVGIFKSGEYEITIVLGKSLAGFNLFYALSGNWIVYEEYYEACKKKIEDTEAWTTTYNTSKETTMSYGPYKFESYEMDKQMVFVKNENWWGWEDGKHIYKDPTDGKYYQMYQTTKITCQVVPEADTRKLMFLSGQLMGYGLQAEDFEEYRNSDFCYATPSETIFFFIFNGHIEAIKEREANKDFDKTKYDLETLTLTSFRKAVAVTYDKEALCTAVSPSRSGGYGLIGNAYLYDPITGSSYRNTDQAKKVLCDFYSVDVSAFESLDAAVDSITGYDVEAARRLYAEAFDEALEKGYITSKDGKTSDQAIEIVYASSETSSFITKTLDYLNEKMAEVLVGTPFEGKVKFVESAPLGNEWSDKLKAGMADTCLAGWQGSALDPFGLTDLYTNPNYQYDAEWFNASTVKLTLNVNVAGIDARKPEMKDVTMNLKQWSDALNGSTVEVEGVEYCFGDGIADVETRLTILAAIEGEVLKTYNYIPMLQDGSMALLSKQVYYVVEEYNQVMGRGGIAYLKYNYNDADWEAYVKSQKGELQY